MGLFVVLLLCAVTFLYRSSDYRSRISSWEGGDLSICLFFDEFNSRRKAFKARLLTFVFLTKPCAVTP